MNIAHLLRQTVQWQAAQSTNNRDDVTYSAALPLQARSVERVRDIIGRDGEITTATNTVILLQEVNIGDLLDGRLVVGVETMTDIRGNTPGFRAFTQ